MKKSKYIFNQQKMYKDFTLQNLLLSQIIVEQTENKRKT